jgi:hypothetical protein
MRRAMLAGRVMALLLALGLTPRLALACSPAILPPVQIEPPRVPFTGEPPVLEAVRLAGLERGVYDGCVISSSLTLDADAWDDRTPADQLAYRVEVLRGEDLSVWEAPLFFRYLTFDWVDDGVDPLDVELRVRAVDAAGRESNPIDIRVTDPGDGSADAGCNMAPPNGRVMAACLPLLAAAAWRLRRRRH